MKLSRLLGRRTAPAHTLPRHPAGRYWVVITEPGGVTDAAEHPTRADALAAWTALAPTGWRVRVLSDREWARIRRNPPTCAGAEIGADRAAACGRRAPHEAHPLAVTPALAPAAAL